MAAKKKRAPKPQTNYGLIKELYGQLTNELKKSKEVVDDDDILTQLNDSRTNFFQKKNEAAALLFMRKIALRLRTTETALPCFDDKIGFFLWIIDNVDGAREGLTLLDDLGWCPDSFRSQLEEHYEDTGYNYKTP